MGWDVGFLGLLVIDALSSLPRFHCKQYIQQCNWLFSDGKWMNILTCQVYFMVKVFTDTVKSSLCLLPSFAQYATVPHPNKSWNQKCFRFQNVCVHTVKYLEDISHVPYTHGLKVILYSIFTVLCFRCNLSQELNFPLVASHQNLKSFGLWSISDFWIRDTQLVHHF